MIYKNVSSLGNTIVCDEFVTLGDTKVSANNKPQTD